MALKQTVAPASTPVTLTEAKAQCRIDNSEEDVYVTSLIAAATDYFDGPNGVLNRALMTQTWQLSYDAFPCGGLQIPLGPVQSITSVEYVDPVTQLYVTWAASNYETDLVSPDAWVIPKDSWPTTLETSNAIRVTFVAGFTTVPPSIKAAILMLIAHWYENRETVTPNANMMPIPYGVSAIIATQNRVGV
jgi:uncharacterized phiE125 gp8 family phage protein